MGTSNPTVLQAGSQRLRYYLSHLPDQNYPHPRDEACLAAAGVGRRDGPRLGLVLIVLLTAVLFAPTIARPTVQRKLQMPPLPNRTRRRVGFDVADADVPSRNSESGCDAKTLAREFYFRLAT